MVGPLNIEAPNGDAALDVGPTLRVLLVDRDALARRAMQQGLEAGGEVTVVADVSDADDALAAVGTASPDLVLIDVGFPLLEGIAVAERLVASPPTPPIVFCAAIEDRETAVRCLAAGAIGFIDKGLDPAALIRALRGVLAGEAAISRRLSVHLIEELRRPIERLPGLRPINSRLTPREWQVLDLIVDGWSTAEMADELGLARETIRSHVKHVLRKLSVGSRRDAAQAALQMRTQGRLEASLPRRPRRPGIR